MNPPNNDVACSICGAEHDNDTSPELDSTHRCPDCAAMLRRATSATRIRSLLSEEFLNGRPAE